MPHGIPTTHKGRLFRSRLEARWGTFFDLLEWPYEYEPFDLDGWIPDFLLTGDRPVLVEIKPVTEFPFDVAEKAVSSGVKDDVLILGCTFPVHDIHKRSRCCSDLLGWIGSRSFDDLYYFSNAVFGHWSLSGRPVGFCEECDFQDRISGAFEPVDQFSWDDRKQQDILALWAKAGNMTQWRRPRGH